MQVLELEAIFTNDIEKYYKKLEQCEELERIKIMRKIASCYQNIILKNSDSEYKHIVDIPNIYNYIIIKYTLKFNHEDKILYNKISNQKSDYYIYNKILSTKNFIVFNNKIDTINYISINTTGCSKTLTTIKGTQEYYPECLNRLLPCVMYFEIEHSHDFESYRIDPYYNFECCNLEPLDSDKCFYYVIQKGSLTKAVRK
ncbi:hypothetical protein Hokovirus_2_8 [Hokovirus HKV1]|uniref:Uncharacterized protein n=1 Tax=Hokovirus HKV1 TaxID=1977638 RepID=A0A1V0SFL8_9VIRU|nr:hypothetical protein Hokovirus_2_8 [Hokovirus HKV1]